MTEAQTGFTPVDIHSILGPDFEPREGITVSLIEMSAGGKGRLTDQERDVESPGLIAYRIANVPLRDDEAGFFGLDPREDGRPHMVTFIFPYDEDKLNVLRALLGEEQRKGDFPENYSYYLKIAVSLLGVNLADFSYRPKQFDLVAERAAAYPDKQILIFLTHGIGNVLPKAIGLNGNWVIFADFYNAYIVPDDYAVILDGSCNPLNEIPELTVSSTPFISAFGDMDIGDDTGEGGTFALIDGEITRYKGYKIDLIGKLTGTSSGE